MRFLLAFFFLIPFLVLVGVCLLSPTATEEHVVVCQKFESPSYTMGTDIQTGDTVAVLMEIPEMSEIQIGDTLAIYYVHTHSDRVQGAIIDPQSDRR
jgi:hypothetical protein